MTGQAAGAAGAGTFRESGTMKARKALARIEAFLRKRRKYRLTGVVTRRGTAQVISSLNCTQTSSKSQDERANLLCGH
jgi:hypothetical protein